MTEGHEALDELYWRAEILQALYWMRGEGLATEVAPAALAEFLASEPGTVAHYMRRLADDGYLAVVTGGDGPGEAVGCAGPSAEESLHAESDAARPVGYRLTPLGAAEGGRSFHDEFAALTRPAHGECAPGCWCHDPKHAGEPCPSHQEAAHGA